MEDMLDVIIVGAGTAGLGALHEVQAHTKRFAIINDGPWGTMCARVGCMPSKALIEAANRFHRRGDFSVCGIRGGDQLTIDIPAVLACVRDLRDKFVAETLEVTNTLGDRAISGRARLLGPDCVIVNGRQLRARHIILAIGSRPVVPDAWKAFGARLLTTDSLFEQPTLPPRMAVVGLGAVGAEMAQAIRRLGVEVTAFDNKTMVAGLTDAEVNQTFLEALRKELPVHLGHEATLSSEGDGIHVKAGAQEVVVDRVLVALGRVPNVDGLGLETLGVPLDEHGVPHVDRTTMRIGKHPVFLVGDAHGGIQLQHEASDDGHIAGRNALGRETTSFRRRTPLSIVFCEPNVALVGKHFRELDPATTVIGEASFDDQGRAQLMHRNVGLLRVYADRGDGALLGAELCAPRGEHLAHFLALAIHRGTTVTELLRAPFYHPCLEEALRTALRAAAKHLPGGETFELSAEG